MNEMMMVGGVFVRQDDDGRFSLNDLHRASGGAKANGPSYWLATDQTKALCAALGTTVIPVVTLEGRNGGTFVVKELVYAYSMWIDADFHLKVIRTFDSLISPQPLVVPQTLSQALRLAADQAEQIEQQQAALSLAAPKVEFVDRYVESTGNKGFREVAKLLGANEARFREFLTAKKIMYRLGSDWTPFAQHLDTGRFVVKAGTSEESGRAFNQAKFTPKGVAWVAGLWMEWKLEQDGGE